MELPRNKIFISQLTSLKAQRFGLRQILIRLGVRFSRDRNPLVIGLKLQEAENKANNIKTVTAVIFSLKST